MQGNWSCYQTRDEATQHGAITSRMSRVTASMRVPGAVGQDCHSQFGGAGIFSCSEEFVAYSKSQNDKIDV